MGGKRSGAHISTPFGLPHGAKAGKKKARAQRITWRYRLLNHGTQQQLSFSAHVYTSTYATTAYMHILLIHFTSCICLKSVMDETCKDGDDKEEVNGRAAL